MDGRIQENKGIVGSLGQVNQGKGDNLSGNSSNSDDGVELGTISIRGLNSGEMVSDEEESRVLDVNTKGIGSTGRMVNPEICGVPGASELSNQGNDIVCETCCEVSLDGRVTNREVLNGRANGKAMDQVVQGSSGKSTNLVDMDRVVLEMVIIIDPEGNTSNNGENGRFEVKGSELGTGRVTVDKPKAKVPKGEKQSCVIDLNSGGGKEDSKDVWDGEKICRICHLSSEGPLESATTSAAKSMDLIQLGCGCKDELGIAHSPCAEAWFKLRGNRVCEICGETAKNVTGIVDNSFMQQWNDRRFRGIGSRSSDRGGGCWRGQPFCNFLLACLVIAFVLPWFFRVNLFN